MRNNRYRAFVYVSAVIATFFASSDSISSRIPDRYASQPGSQSAVPTAAIRIELVDNQNFRYIASDVECGCAYYLPGQEPNIVEGNWKYLLIANQSEGWMRINGSDVKLRLARNSVRYTGRPGERFSQTYTGRDFKVNVACIIKASDSEGGAVDVTASVKVVRGKRSKLIKAEGRCHCM